ncbi:MAG: response regulator transcription factor [Firmicutes bacterium]|nr:response regulator transcription factor [Bacillota bacterium]
MSPRILVVDDDRKITALLRRGLSFAGYTVDVANNGSEGLKLAMEHQPDLVILDLMMPVMDGWQLCQRLRAGSDVPILMLTARDEIADRVRGLDTGADDYLVKPFAFEELLARVRALLRRTRPGQDPGKTILRYADLSLDQASREARRGDRLISLTAKEYELLLAFMEHPRQVLTRELLMERVWGYDYSGESNVLEVYVALLRQKLEGAGEKRLIHTVRGVGYVLKE